MNTILWIIICLLICKTAFIIYQILSLLKLCEMELWKFKHNIKSFFFIIPWRDGWRNCFLTVYVSNATWFKWHLSYNKNCNCWFWTVSQIDQSVCTFTFEGRDWILPWLCFYYLKLCQVLRRCSKNMING